MASKKTSTTKKQAVDLLKQAQKTIKSSSSTTKKIPKKQTANTIKKVAETKLTKVVTSKPRSKKKRKQKLILIVVLFVIILIAGYFAYEEVAPFSPKNEYEPQPLSEYYQGADGLAGHPLRVFLQELMKTDFVGVNYGVARQALADADVDPNDATKVLTIYSRDSVKRVWDGSSWHREHVWPNSRLGVKRVTNTQINQASDLHNLRAIVPSINSSRSNKVFDSTTSPDTYFPGDEDKGDVARILFYMVIAYPFMSLTDDILPNDSTTNYTLEGAKMSRFSLLLQWHYEDPVDDFERNRNEVIYGYQNNRNPFIDHPEFVALIFEHEDYSPLSATQNEPEIVIIYYIEIKRQSNGKYI